jgi:hypothetical protein
LPSIANTLLGNGKGQENRLIAELFDRKKLPRRIEWKSIAEGFDFAGAEEQNDVSNTAI